jgi:uncharacterized protein with HEPN domain
MGVDLEIIWEEITEKNLDEFQEQIEEIINQI